MAISEIIDHLLEKESEMRPQSAAVVAQQLRSLYTEPFPESEGAAVQPAPEDEDTVAEPHAFETQIRDSDSDSDVTTTLFTEITPEPED